MQLYKANAAVPPVEYSKIWEGRGTVDQNLPRYSSNTLYCFFDKQKTYKMLDKKGGVIHQRYCLKYKNSWKKLEKKVGGKDYNCKKKLCVNKIDSSSVPI